jgi:uncharacterized protein YdeI (YjbR/CyaY-like superfamily)
MSDQGPDAIPHGTVHLVPDDLQAALRDDPAILVLWQGLTPLGRNEFICWVEDARQPATRERRIERTRQELLEGKKRPCCWAAASTGPTRRPADGRRRC